MEGGANLGRVTWGSCGWMGLWGGPEGGGTGCPYSKERGGGGGGGRGATKGARVNRESGRGRRKAGGGGGGGGWGGGKPLTGT